MSKIRDALKNNIYAFRFIFSLSHRRIYHTVLTELIFYVAWVFYSTFFIKVIVEAIGSKKPFSEIANFIIIVGIIAVVNCLYTLYCENSLLPYEDTVAKKKFIELTCHKASRCSLDKYENPEYYDNYTIVLNEAWNKLSDAVKCQISIVLTILTSIMFIVTMFTIDKAVMLFLIIPLIGNFIIAPITNELIFKRYQESVRSNRRMGYIDRIMYLVRYSKDIKMTDIGNVLKNEYEKSVNELEGIADKYKTSTIRWGTIHYMFSYSFFFEGVLLYGAYKVMIVKDGMSIEDMTILTSAMVTASWVLGRLINAIIDYNKNSLFIYKFKEFMNLEEQISGGMAVPDHIDSIEFQNVSFAYGDKLVLKDLSFIIHANETVAIVGGNGAGKTTLIKALLGLYTIKEGRILINGIDHIKFNINEYLKLFSVVFQDFAIYADTVRYNILLGREVTNADEKIIDILKMLGLFDRISNDANGLDSELTKEFYDEGLVLSGGQLQKLALARTLLGNSKICILDEPTSALDPISEKDIYDLLMKKDNSIKIFISHKLTSARNADMILVLNNGEIVEQGKHNELMKNNGTYKHLFDLQMENYFPGSREAC